MRFKSWMDLSKPDNLIQSLRPLTYISWMSIVPFKFNVNRENRVYIPLYSVVIGITHYLLFVILLQFSESWLNLIIISTILGFGIIKRQQLINVIQNLILVEDIFRRLGVKANYHRIFRFTFFTSLAMIFWDMIHLVVYIRYDITFIISDVIFHLKNFNISMVVLKFFCLTHLGQSLFRNINEALQDILEDHTALELSPIHSAVKKTSFTYQSYSYAVIQISNIHNLVCDICESIEEYFVYPLLVILTSATTAFINGGCYVGRALINYDTISDHYQSQGEIILLFNAIWFIVITFVIVWVSSSTTRQSSSSATIVHKILNKTDDQKLKDRLHNFSLQLIHRKISFTAGGLINLDRTFILTLFSGVIGYVIVVKEFFPDVFKKIPDFYHDNSTDYICLQRTDELVPKLIKIANLTNIIEINDL